MTLRQILSAGLVKMDKSFQTVLSLYKKAPTLSHKQEVQRLYRRALRLVNSWCESRVVFNEEATLIRAEFDANKHYPADSGATVRLMNAANARIFARTHPDPYIVPYMPGGSLFMRNSPPPLSAIYPDGIPEGISKRRVNIDFSNLPDDQEYADNIFVDSANKVYFIDK